MGGGSGLPLSDLPGELEARLEVLDAESSLTSPPSPAKFGLDTEKEPMGTFGITGAGVE